MTGLLVVLIPLLLLFFMFAMQSIESSLLSTPDSPVQLTHGTPTKTAGNPLPNESALESATQSNAQAA